MLLSILLTLSALSIAAYTFLLRSNFRLRGFVPPPSKARYPIEGSQGDAACHLWLIDLIRKNGNKIPETSPQFLLSGPMDYPAFFHKLLSYFPKTRIEKSEWVINPVIDSFHALCVFLASIYLLFLIGFDQFSMFQKVIFPLLITLSWTILPMTNSPIKNILNERPFGVLFGHAYLFCAVMYLITNHYVFTGLASVCFVLLAASSKFSFQSVVFISVAYTLISFEPIPLIIVALSFLLSIAVTRGYTLRVARGTIRHSTFYMNFLVKHHGYTLSFSHKHIIKAGKLAVTGRFLAAKRVIQSHPIYKIWFLSPWLIPFFLNIALDNSHPNEIYTHLEYWVWSGIIVTLLTATDWFKFLGEAERYQEYIALPMIFLCLTSSSELVQIAVIFAVMLSIYGITRPQGGVSSASNETIDLHRWLEEQPVSTIFCLPGGLCFPMAYDTEHKFIQMFINIAEGELQEEFKSLFEEEGASYPCCAPSFLKKAHRKYKADLLILDKRELNTLATRQGIHYEIDEASIIYNNDRYVVMDAAQYAKNTAES